MDRFSVSKRTAQRMLRALEGQFPDTNTDIDDAGCKRWKLPSGALRDLISLLPEELAALDLAIATLRNSALGVEADQLLRLREKIVALVPRSKVARLETDHEALLEAQGLAWRPGPRQRIDRDVSMLRLQSQSRHAGSWISTILPATSSRRAPAASRLMGS